MEIKIAVAADTKRAQAQFAALAAQVKQLNADIAGAAMVPQGGTADGYRRIASSLSMVDREFLSSLASSGKFRVEQIKVNDAVNRNIDLLQKQKLKISEVFGKKGSVARNNMEAVYREQLAMQQMSAKINDMGIGDGKMRASLLIPTEVHESWDTLNKRVGMFGYQLASASETMVNWGKNTQWAGRQLMVGFTMPALAFGAAAGVMAYKVDDAMTRITKVYDVSAEAQKNETMRMAELEAVRQRAFDNSSEAARKYGTAIEDTLAVQSQLAATGLTGAKLDSSTMQTVRIATLGDLDFTAATDMTVALQNAFRDTIKTADDLTNTFNFMNAVENATSLSIQDIAEATPRAASAMSALGVSAEEMTVLMVSMAEAGVDAAEGANALKSATGSILAPSPAADEFIQQISKGRVQVSKLAEESGGNLFKALQLLSLQMEGLNDLQKQQILVKLFGKYQFNRVSAMVYNLGDAFTGTANQTSKALDLMGADMSELAKRADDELGQITESASGKFRIAWQSLRAELSELGEPFLNVARWALDAVNKVVSAFNKLPDSVKHLAMIGVIGMAVIGPLVMLIGLFANFMGNIGKFTAFLLKATSSFKLFNKAEWANKLATDLANKGLVTQGDATQQLAGRVQVLTEAMEKYNQTLLQYAGIADLADQQAMNNLVVPGSGSTANVAGVAMPMYGPTGVPKPGPAPTLKYNKPELFSEGGVVMERMVANKELYATELKGYQLQQKLFDEQEARNKLQLETNKRAAAETKIRDTTAKSINMATVGMTAMVAGSTALMFSSNETLNKIIEMGMIGSILVPAVGMLASGFAKATAVASKFVGQLIAARAATAAGTVAAAGMKATLMSGIKGAGSSLLGLVGGPIGAAVVGVGAITYGLYKWQQHAEAISKEYAKQNNTLYDQRDIVAEILDIQPKKPKTIAPSFGIAEQSKEVTTAADTLISSDDEEIKGLISLIKETEDQTKLATVAQQAYSTALTASGGDADKAMLYVEALWTAAGKGASQATFAAQKAKDVIGTMIDDIEQSDLITNLVNDALLDDNLKDVEDTGQKIGTELMDAMARAADPSIVAKSVTDALANTSFDSVFRQIGDNADLQMLGIGDANTLKVFYENMMDGTLEYSAIAQQTGMEIDQVINTSASLMRTLQNEFGNVIGKAEELDRIIAQVLGKQLGYGGSFLESLGGMEDLEKQKEYQIYIANEAQARAMYEQDIREASKGTLAYGKELTTQQKLQILNLYRSIRGLDEANSLSDGFKRNVKDAADEAEEVQKQLNKLPSSITVDIRADQVKGLLSDAMGGVQSTIADTVTSSREAAWDAQAAALDRRQEAAQNAFDARWERRKEGVEKYYDARIEKVQEAIEAEEKAEEIRQRIFEAEMTRLSRLADTANSTIDFNMALETGSLDEAAKIRNDMEATAREWQLQDAGGKASSRSERIRERLQGKADRLGERKDKAMEALEKKEEAERASLERRQQAARDHQQAIQDIERESLEKQMELFRSFVPKNKAQLEAWMKEVGITYENFGIKTLDPTSLEWANFFRTNFNEQIRKGGAEIASDNMWESMGKNIAIKTLKGMGFPDLASLEKFVMTGELPKSFGNSSKKTEINLGADDRRTPLETRHTGGVVGSGGGSRKGVARTAPMHKSEQMILAQKGEMVVNRDSTSKYAQELDAINKGVFDPMDGRAAKNIGEPQGGIGFSGLIASAIGRMFAAGVARALTNNVSEKMAEIKSMSRVGPLAGLEPGVFGDVAFDAEQLRNAQVIANVGKNMGMSSRDIEIAIMTAITESSLRNVNYGDLSGPDSRGLFQQRDSWGSLQTRMDPAGAARLFYQALKGVTNRAALTPWMAAQTVQRSAYSDGSNYRPYWNEAQAIFNRMSSASTASTTSSVGGFVAGVGGKHRPISGPVTSGLHGGTTPGNPPAVDLAGPVGRPVYAVSDGTITSSRDIPGPLATDSYHDSKYGPYGSFGRVITMNTVGGAGILYAHLSRRSVSAGQQVKGGSIIGYSGSTGNSSGPHLHFGATNGPMAWLKTGGNTLSDGLAMLHKNETVLTEPLSNDLKATVTAFGDISRNVGWENALAGVGSSTSYSRVNADNVASSTHNEYNVEVNVMQPSASADEIANKVIKTIKREEARKPGKR